MREILIHGGLSTFLVFELHDQSALAICCTKQFVSLDWTEGFSTLAFLDFGDGVFGPSKSSEKWSDIEPRRKSADKVVADPSCM